MRKNINSFILKTAHCNNTTLMIASFSFCKLVRSINLMACTGRVAFEESSEVLMPWNSGYAPDTIS